MKLSSFCSKELNKLHKNIKRLLQLLIKLVLNSSIIWYLNACKRRIHKNALFSQFSNIIYCIVVALQMLLVPMWLIHMEGPYSSLCNAAFGVVELECLALKDKSKAAASEHYS